MSADRRILVALIAASVVCTRPASARDPGLSALRLVEDLVRSGRRYAGAADRSQAIDDLARRLGASGLEVQRDSFLAHDPKDGTPRLMTNLIGRFRPTAKCRILLGSHFDTRHVAEEDPNPANRGKPIPGANDGTSGVAVLLELTRSLSHVVAKDLGVDIAFFDGEEMGYPRIGGYCLGSRHYASGPLLSKPKPRFGVILDMVCDKRAVYYIEKNSRAAAPQVADALWAAGARAAPKAFPRKDRRAIVDDHVPLSDAGVPSVLLIGFDYPEWHTLADTPDKCSSERLGLIVRTLSDFLRERAGALARCEDAAPKKKVLP